MHNNKLHNANKTLSFAIFGNTFQAEKSANIKQVLQSILKINGTIAIEKGFAQFLLEIVDISNIPFTQFNCQDIEADYAISIGGDGTFLNTAQLIGSRNIPIIGINTGRLGFISDVLPEDTDSFFLSLKQGNFFVEERSLLEVKAEGDKMAINPIALNEIAILKHDNSSMINISTYVDDKYLATYLSDGLIIATPTGSTGYSLSVGGPIISPDSKSIILSPIAAHSLSVRPFIVNDNVRITLKINSRTHNYMIAIDGRSQSINENTTIHIARAPYNVSIVRNNDHSFFDTLRNKLLWGADKR